MRIKKYLEKYNLKNTWFTAKVGVDPLYASQWKCNNSIPVKYWEKIVEATSGKVTYRDLWMDFMGRSEDE